MGRTTDLEKISYYCSENCKYASHRQEETPLLLGAIERLNRMLETDKDRYRQALAIISETKPNAEYRSQKCDGTLTVITRKEALDYAEKMVTDWNTNMFRRKYYKLLLERAPYEVVELTRLKMLKYVGERLERELTRADVDNEKISKISNFIAQSKPNNIDMQIFCSR